MPDIIAGLTFHPVGQGLFTSGHVLRVTTASDFTWVFDCGSTSQRYLRPAVTAYTSAIGKGTLAMLVISHFDKDHISGLVDLLTGRSVRCVVLPYVPLWFRMHLAVVYGAVGGFLRFLIDPAAYLASISGEVGQVIYVSGGDDGRSAPPPGADGSEFPPEGHRVDPSDAPDSTDELRRRTTMVSHSRVFGVQSWWEFVFFNETPPSKVSIPTLQAAVRGCLARHQTKGGQYAVTAMLQDLRRIYDNHFGSGGGPRNDISLSMYSGPTKRPNGVARWHGHIFESGAVFGCNDWWLPYLSGQVQPSPPCHLSTGDASFDTPTKIEAIKAHLGTRRWNRFVIFQVPHHGSVHSWYPGAATKFTHSVSILAASSTAKHHPHPAVVSDLAKHQPVVVSERAGFSSWGWI